MGKCIKLFFMIIVGLSAGSYVASSQGTDLGNISEKLSRLERDIQVLSRRVYNGEEPLSTKSAQLSSSGSSEGGISSANIIRLEDRLADLRGELQNSTNRMESISYNLDEIKARLDKLVSDIDFRLTRLESVGKVSVGSPSATEKNLSAVPRTTDVKRIGPATGGPVVSSVKPGILGEISETNLREVKRQASKNGQNTPSFNSALIKKEAQQTFLLPKGTPKVQYLYALSILRKTEYSNAELAFAEFIKMHPKDKLTPNARYWLGESFYVRKNYRSAAEAFLRGYQQAPKGLKAPSSLLKLGMSLANLEKTQDACATFSKLAKDFPNASENIKKHLSREFKRSSCN